MARTQTTSLKLDPREQRLIEWLRRELNMSSTADTIRRALITTAVELDAPQALVDAAVQAAIDRSAYTVLPWAGPEQDGIDQSRAVGMPPLHPETVAEIERQRRSRKD
jgi:hypothetical protein